MAIDTVGKRQSAASSRGGFRGGYVRSSGGGTGDALEATSQEILAKQLEILAAIDDAVQEVSAVMINNSGEAY